MKDIPLLSIKCFVYNHELYLRQCLDGFVMQKTTFPFEAIVHDDASTDGSAAIIREYAEKYPDIIKPIYETENQYSKRDGSLRRVVEAAISPFSKYLAICEGDDYWTDPLKLQKQVDFLESNPEYVLVYTSAEKVDANSKKLLRNSLKGISGNITEYFFYKGNPVITATVCYRYKYWEDYVNELSKIPFKIKMGDLPLWIYLSLQGKFKYINEKTTSYRVLIESASHSKKKENVISFITNTRDILLYFNNRYNLEISEAVICKRYYKSLIRNMASFDRLTFKTCYYNGIKKYTSLLFDVKLLTIFFIRMFINKKC